MRLRHATARMSTVLLLAAAAVSISGSPPAGARPGPAGGSAAGTGPFQLTLVTGDRLMLRADANGGVAADGRTPVLAAFPGKGRTDVRFTIRHDRGDTYVIPSDALGLIRAGRVDERLFNVSGLIRDGYDDKARGSVPLILAFDGARRAALTTAKATKTLPSVGGTAADVAKADAAAFWAQVAGPQTLAAGVRKVWLDAKVRASLDHSVPQIGAPQAWEAGYTGAGTTVAVLDTGIDTTHPDLADAVVGAQDFSGTGNTTDKVGHGTHVAGIVTGSGAASGGRYKGVAPDTKLLNGKVLDDGGGGYESGIIAGMEWAAGQGADVINMSLGGGPSAGDRPMDLAVNELTRTTGSLFVIAAGNRGPGAGSVSSPGSADAALTVGAVDRNDAIAEFSSRGPRVGDNGLKPDITAPGVGIVAPLAADSLIGDELPHVDDRYVALDGTSMASPHVAGAAAILAGQHPGWDADELKAALMATAKPTPGVSAFEQGTGRVDVARAVGQSLWSSPTSINNGTVLWPHGDDAPIARDITYHNAGDMPVTLALTTESDAPAGLFTVAPAQLTVPAGGTATATFTTDTSVPADDRMFTGAVVATAGDVRVRTTTAVNREVESYEVDVTVLGSDGQPTPDYWMRFVDVAQPRAVVPYDESGRVTARVPKGTHYVDGWLQEDASPNRLLTLFTEPSFVVNGPTKLTLDARTAKPTGATVDRADAATVTGSVMFDRVTDWGGTGSGTFGGLQYIRVAPSTTTAPNDKFTYLVEGIYARPDSAGEFDNSPYIYSVLWSQPGRVPTELVRAVHDNELAAVRTDLAAEEPGELIAVNDSVTYRAPATIAQYFTPGVTWQRSMYGVTADNDLRWYEAAPPRTFTLGNSVTERWNRAVYGFALADAEYDGAPAAGRLGDQLYFYLPLRSGQGAGHHGSRYDDPLKVTLSRDGKVVGEATDFWADFAVPADVGTYRLTASATSDTPLRTRLDAAWTFRSAHVDGDEPGFLPLLALRFAPDLDQNNTAPAGRPFVVPVSVQRQVAGDYGRTRRVAVQVSYDDGATWRPAPVLGAGDQRTAVLVHPKGAKHVSLRGSVTDSRGNTAEITVIRAYALR